MEGEKLTKSKKRSARNKTITLSDTDVAFYKTRLRQLTGPVQPAEIIGRTLCQDLFEALDWLPERFVDLLFADPPYNLDKTFNDYAFSERPVDEYEAWLDSWVSRLRRVLKPTASIYICGDWRSSAAIYRVLRKYFTVRNRITWQREKGRGAKSNWKNSSEDIWFCTVSDDYVFNVNDVKLKRKVIAPYTRADGAPKDWTETETGRFRLTHPSNLWTDITVPFWSMPENTDHPTQKPEKLLAKIILASSNEGDVIFDPFLGSGTTSVTAKKLGRRFVGIEIDEFYCCLAEKRLAMAEENKRIQGYVGGHFWERNTLAEQKKHKKRHSSDRIKQPTLFSQQEPG
jgi:site-specific DNA-methyltransferase (adenine-specific)